MPIQASRLFRIKCLKSVLYPHLPARYWLSFCQRQKNQAYYCVVLIYYNKPCRRSVQGGQTRGLGAGADSTAPPDQGFNPAECGDRGRRGSRARPPLALPAPPLHHQPPAPPAQAVQLHALRPRVSASKTSKSTMVVMEQIFVLCSILLGKPKLYIYLSLFCGTNTNLVVSPLPRLLRRPPPPQ